MEPTFILIDGSYFCFYRYHSLLTWWKNAYPEQQDVLQNPYLCEEFVYKFKKTFIETVRKLKKGINLDKSIDPIIIVGKDCKRADIWRNKLINNYKGTRDNSLFMGAPFFKMVYDDNLFLEGGVSKILKHSQLEADDCIAIYTKKLLQKYPLCNINIITSDKDYLQLASEQVKLFNLAFKKLTDQKSCMGDSKCDLFCKILTGDVSDNIPSVFPKCGPKTALKYFNDPDLLDKKLLEKEEFRSRYELNRTIIDFNYIPSELVEEFLIINE